MENPSSLKSTNVRYFKRYTENSNFLSPENTGASTPILKNILSEEGGNFYEYLSWIRLSKEPSLMILSSRGHYYYDHHDLIGIKVLVNLKQLNFLKHLESFLHILNRMLPEKANFVGCFKNDGLIAGNNGGQGQVKCMKEFLNVFNKGARKILSRRNVTKLLEDHRFKVIDMTEIKGLTYFWAQSLKEPE